MNSAGSFTVDANTSLMAAEMVLLSYGLVTIATGGVAPSDPVAVVAVVSVVAVCYPVVYQGSVFVLTELTDQLGLES